MSELLTVFWSEDCDSDRAAIDRPALRHAAFIAIARHGDWLEESCPDWLNKRITVPKTELREWFEAERIPMRTWIDSQPVSHWYAQLDSHQQFAFRLRWF